MSGDIESQVKSAMQAAFEHLKAELKTLRTGRANTAILDKITVEVYGSRVPLKSLANITVPEVRQIVVTPFDQSNANPIAKAIEAANLGVNPMVDGKLIRINIPPMDEAVRKQIAKQCKEHGEKTKISLRDVRRKYNELIRKQKTDGTIPEDQLKRLEKQIQDLTDKYCKDVDETCVAKEKEILTI
ncbi:MAG: ribosome recycling factor [Chlamydiae bacterium RIFCSPHIGHO2_12_FULL_44_59]|nr:MAG: ribosome recycling factor [Chlamydiae bacterium RIFCSPHIGHO2_01_FULL_44_39]OGN59351.1 MAG: ribosome recycling factor [Chlamydiae bacterium RIFCSPHIGHO2_02_FULL_45_9]OGN60563.1 MAG: ribosome recycling factor [Chlamydiae bacterium RIFCSPHIGHO2_12_FULL_44_59]OGN66613.1 MAG: ribosome recycling factor [Chlamydiae bacterium RIFCSPLOWO2_01_FULL_44_52]OGN69863.1 MAG: ribosome recycling factor [Chlamydiae bacterium RIFCSPLOWO2_02_FULL_45_22]OGN70474.1 MAG: ribosome recycling factor [Chlamydiae 